MLELLVPPTHAQTRCGTHIAKFQPDVEVCAMSLTKLPANRAEFEAMRGSREFIIAKFLVLGLGPPGFGKVPYNSKRSAGQKEEAGKPLYESTDDGRVRLFSFDKGKTNKDKGDRVETPEHSGLLEPGLVLSFFLREDFFDPTKIAPSSDGDEAAFVGTVLALQLASGNVDAAAKGYLVKLKKAKILPPSFDLFAALPKLPRSEEEYDSRAARYRSDCPAMKGSLDSSGDMRCFAVQGMGPEACAYAHDGGVLISNARTHNCEGFRDDIFVPTRVLLQCLQIADEEGAVKFLNVALAVEAVGAIIKTCTSNVLLSSEDVHPLLALGLVLDVSLLLSLDALATPDARAFLQSDATPDQQFVAGDVTISKSTEHIHWSNKKQTYATTSDSAQVSFTLHASDRTGPECGPPAHCQLSLGCSGAYRTLSVFLGRQGFTRKIIDLEMRVSSAASMRQKRKRPELAFEE